MTKRYQIKGIKGSWLHQPGMMVYVEKEYDEPVNDVIKQYHDALSEWCTKNGLIFLYIPKFYRYENWKWYTFMTGKKAHELPYETTSIVLKHSLSEASLQQIEGPSLVFTSHENDELLAYRIEGNREKTIEDSLLNILSDYLQDSGITTDAWMDERLDHLRSLIEGKKIDERITCASYIDSPLFSEEKEEENHGNYKEAYKANIENSGTRFRISRESTTTQKRTQELKYILDEDSVELHTGATRKHYASQEDDDILFRVSREEQKEEELPKPRTCESRNECLYTSEEPPEYARQDQLKEDSPIDTHQLNEAVHIIAKFLRAGYTKETIWAMIEPFQELSPIHITKDLRIILPLYDKEIELPPVQKAVFLLFLKHPEGIYFKNLISHHTELYQLYRKLAIRGSSINHATTVMDLVNPLSNSMNEKCSQIKKRIQAILDDSLAKHYYISGAKGELKRIDINPDMIVWE